MFYIFSGKQIAIVDSFFRVKNKKDVKFYSTQSRANYELFPTSSNPAIYEPHFFNYQVFLANNLFYLSIDTEHTLFNAYTNIDYYKKAKCFAVINPVDIKIKKLFANRNGIYLNKSNLPFFNGISGIEAGDKIAISYEADSLIRLYNPIVDSFISVGIQPKFFNSNYNTYTKIEVAFNTELYKNDKLKFGHYGNLFFNQANKLLLREFYTGQGKMGNSSCGFQIFKLEKNRCIAEFFINHELKIFNYEGNIISAYKIKNNNEIIIYNLKLL